MMDEIRSSEMLVLTTATRHHIQGDGIPHSHHHENLKSVQYSINNNTIQYFISCQSERTYIITISLFLF
jgi:hypothetical protein